MPQLNADRYVAEIEASTAGLAEILAEYDQSLPIPTCPEWTLRQLVTHVGRAHRWAAEITRTRSDAFIPFREVPDGKLPDDRAEQRAGCMPARRGSSTLCGKRAVISSGRSPGRCPPASGYAGWRTRRWCTEPTPSSLRVPSPSQSLKRR